MHHAELRCSDCGRHLKWVGRAIDCDEALGFVLPFGEYKGIELAHVPSSYLCWLATRAERVSPRIRERARLILEVMPAERGGRA
jgi:uncharacterized protein (DUF3820 family)